MAHKPLIGGTAYEIGGGKDLIGGTVYAKDHGKTLVGGTVYEVGFAPSEAKITINTTFPSNITDGSSPTAYAYIEIDGVKYGTATEIVVPVGTVISCYGKNAIFLNDKTVQTGGTYAYTVQGDIGIKLSVESKTYGPGMVLTNGFLYITEL